MFGTPHPRVADPAVFADTVGADGFAVVILAVKSDRGRPRKERRSGDEREGPGGGGGGVRASGDSGDG